MTVYLVLVARVVNNGVEMGYGRAARVRRGGVGVGMVVVSRYVVVWGANDSSIDVELSSSAEPGIGE